MALTRPRAAQIYDIDYKQATRVVTVVNITLTGGAPNQVDGVNLSINDRILVTGQSTLSQNGVYYVTTLGSGSNGTWSRSLDTNNTGEILTGTIVMVTEGTIYADTQWKLITDGIIDVGVTDQVWTQNYSANSISSGNSNVVVLSNANVLISSAGTANVVDVFGTGIKITGTESVTGNVTAGNVLTAGLISATGNIIGDYFLGNVFFANGITASKIYSGNSEVNVTASGGNVNVSIGGTSNVAVFTTAGEYITGLLSVTGNTTSGNLITTGQVSATGNITANYFLGNVACASGIFSTKIFSGTTEANIVSANGNLAISVDGTSNVAVFATTGEYVTGILSASGNVTGGNVLTGGIVSATGNVGGGNISTAGNVTGNYLIGNASQVTGINAFSQIFVTGTGTINAASLTSNVTFAAGANIELTSSGNIITIAYTESSGGSIFATGGDMGLISQPVTATEDLGSVLDLPSISYDLGSLFSVTTVNQLDVIGFSGNVNAANVNLTGLISAAGNITGGNILTIGVVSATGNVTGNYFIGNGSALTGITAGSTIANAINITLQQSFGGF